MSNERERMSEVHPDDLSGERTIDLWPVECDSEAELAALRAECTVWPAGLMQHAYITNEPEYVDSAHEAYLARLAMSRMKYDLFRERFGADPLDWDSYGDPPRWRNCWGCP